MNLTPKKVKDGSADTAGSRITANQRQEEATPMSHSLDNLDLSSETQCVCFQGRVSELPAGPEPPFFNNPPNLMTSAGADKSPVNTSFGDVLEQVLPLYRKVGQLVMALPRGN